MDFLWTQLFRLLGPAFVGSARSAASAADDLAGSAEDPSRFRDQAYELRVHLRRLGGSVGEDDAAEATVTLTSEILYGIWDALLERAFERWLASPSGKRL